MKRKTFPISSLLIVSYFFATILIAIDIGLRTGGLRANDGFSFYGGFAQTVLLYTIALLSIALCMFSIFKKLKNKKQTKKLADVFLIMGFCLVGLVLTPHTVVNSIHTFFGAFLFAVQLLLMTYLSWRSRYAVVMLSTIAMLGFGIMAMLYLHPETGYELQAQAGFQISFAAGLAYYFNRDKSFNV